MKLRIYFYRITRIIFGLILAIFSCYNAIKYENFLGRLDNYFTEVSFFGQSFLEASAPLVPFEMFVIGFFLVCGIWVKQVLKIAMTLFGFFILFLLDATRIDYAMVHFIFFLIAFILFKKDHYNLTSLEYTKDFYQIM